MLVEKVKEKLLLKKIPHCLLQGSSQSRNQICISCVSCIGRQGLWYIYTIEYYSAVEKNKIMPFAETWMDLESIILSEVSQTEKDKYCIISLACRILKKMVQMNLPEKLK